MPDRPCRSDERVVSDSLSFSVRGEGEKAEAANWVVEEQPLILHIAHLLLGSSAWTRLHFMNDVMKLKLKYLVLINFIFTLSVLLLSCKNKPLPVKNNDNSAVHTDADQKLKRLLKEYKEVRLELANEQSIYSHNKGKIDDEIRKSTLERLELIKFKLSKIGSEIGGDSPIDEDLKSCQILISEYAIHE